MFDWRYFFCAILIGSIMGCGARPAPDKSKDTEQVKDEPTTPEGKARKEIEKHGGYFPEEGDKSVIHVRFRNKGPTDAVLKDLAPLLNKLGQPIDLNLNQCDQFTNDAIVHLKGLKNLRRLNLNKTEVNDEGLEQLAAMTELEELHIDTPYITNDGLAFVGKLKKLRRLWVNGGATNITYKGMAHLKDLSNLETLEGSVVDSLNDESMYYVKFLTKLKRFSMVAPSVSDGGLLYLTALTDLEELTLAGIPTTDASLKCLENMKKLKHLTINTADRVTNDGLVHLKGLNALESLTLNFGVLHSKLDGSAFVHLKDLPRVKKLEYLCNGPNDALPFIGQMKNLEELSFLYNKAVGDAGLGHLAGLPKLRILHAQSTKITNDGLVALQGSKSLREIHLHETKVTDAAVKKLTYSNPELKVHR